MIDSMSGRRKTEHEHRKQARETTSPIWYATKRYMDFYESGRHSQGSLHSGEKKGSTRKMLGAKFALNRSAGSLNGDIDKAGGANSNRSARLMSAGLRFKGAVQQNKCFNYKNDRVYDSVAESLYRIHDKINRTQNRRNERIHKKTSKLRDYHS